VKKASPPKTKGIHFGQEILFHTRDERGEFSLFNVRKRPRIISSQLPASPAKFDCIAQRGWTSNGDNPICAQAVTIRWNDAMWLVKPCVACVRSYARPLRCVRCVVKETAPYFYDLHLHFLFYNQYNSWRRTQAPRRPICNKFLHKLTRNDFSLFHF